jgi:hypothetical protein
MSSNYCRYVLYGVCLITITALAACAVSLVPKVRCDTDLRPINSPEHRLP